MKGLILILAIFLLPSFVSAHPGRTAADGCHYCRTNCDKWGVPWGERHCHDQISQEYDYKRGYFNYQDIISGKKDYKSLSNTEKQEVLLIIKLLKKSSSYDDGDSEDCRDAKDAASSAAQKLASYARKLKRCADNEDFNDDCSTEVRRARNSQSNYESAISEVQSYCSEY